MATDKLANVKKFFYGVVLDGFGQRRHIGFDDQPEDVKYVHNKVVPALWDAIRTDDPSFNPDTMWFGNPPAPMSKARRTGAMRWFVALLELQRAQMELVDRNTAVYIRMFKPSAQFGCFLDDLTTALQRDDPDWRGPLP